MGNVDCCSQRKSGLPLQVKIPPWRKVDEVSESQDLLKSNASLTVTFMHWNILANKVADSFPKVPKEYIKWDHRFNIILQQIQHLNPDCLGLSEVDVYPLYKEIANGLNNMGYNDYFIEKQNGISGSAIFYKKDKFVCLEQNSFTFSEKGHQFYMYCRLTPKSPGNSSVEGDQQQSMSGVEDTSQQFIFGETHLKAKPEFEDTRVSQCLKIRKFFKTNYQNIPVVIGGDFNEEPQNAPIMKVMESEFIDLYTQMKFQTEQLSQNQEENHQKFTTFKYREETGMIKRCIDYMFLAENQYYENNKVMVKEYIDMADYESMGYLNQETGSPSRYQPSDHYSVAYKVQFQFNQE